MTSTPKGHHRPDSQPGRTPRPVTGAATPQIRRRGRWLLAMAVVLMAAAAINAWRRPAVVEATPTHGPTDLQTSASQVAIPAQPPTPQLEPRESDSVAAAPAAATHTVPFAPAAKATTGLERTSMPLAGAPGGAPLPERHHDAGPPTLPGPPQEINALPQPLAPSTGANWERAEESQTSDTAAAPERQ